MDEIILSFPAKPDYISVARLTASGIAARAGFNIDEIEDLKVAVSEAAIFIINQNCNIDNFIMKFHIHKTCDIDVSVETEKIIMERNNTIDEQNKLSLFIIESLMDKVDLVSENNMIYKIVLYKNAGGKH